MKKIYLLLLVAALTWGCGEKGSKSEKAEDSKEETEVGEEEVAEEEGDTKGINFVEFDWSKIPVSNADIGGFPYISPPKTMVVGKAGLNGVSENPYSTLWDFNMLLMYDGKNMYKAEGKRAYLTLDMEDGTKRINQYKFDRSVEEYLKEKGAVQIYSGKVPNDIIEAIDKQEGEKTCYEHFASRDPGHNDIRYYALNHSNGKMFLQVASSSFSAEIGVLELEGFKQSIKAPTASEMMEDINKNGKAILNINFDTNKATLKTDGEKLVNEISVLLTENPDLKLSIEGHTDNEGDAAANIMLSEKRANTVKFALGAKGIEIDRLSSKGFGGANPLVSNDSDENKAKNRRVELVKK